MRKLVSPWVGILVVVTLAAQAAPGEGLQMRVENQAWEGLKGRLMVGASTSLRSEFGGTDTDPPKISSLSVMGDYYFSGGRQWLGQSGGLRATSGLLLGSRGSLWSSPIPIERRVAPSAYMDGTNESSATLPYLGVGYSGLSSKGWGLSADVGLMAQSPRSAVRLGSQSLDDTMRDLRFSPILQLGFSYSF